MLNHVICNADGLTQSITPCRIPLTAPDPSELQSKLCPGEKTWLILELADFIHDAVLTETVPEIRDRLSG